MAQRDGRTSRLDAAILGGQRPDDTESRVTSWLQQIQQANKLPSEDPPAIPGYRQPPARPSKRAAFLSKSGQYVREDDDQTLLSCPRVAVDYAAVPRDSTAPSTSTSRRAPSSHDHAFSKRKRHKTRMDRYDVGGGKRRETSKRHRSSESRRNGRSKKLRTGQEVMENFTPGAIAHGKITVKPRLSVGMLLNGKSSRRRPMTDLSFNAMPFLDPEAVQQAEEQRHDMTLGAEHLDPANHLFGCLDETGGKSGAVIDNQFHEANDRPQLADAITPSPAAQQEVHAPLTVPSSSTGESSLFIRSKSAEHESGYTESVNLERARVESKSHSALPARDGTALTSETVHVGEDNNQQALLETGVFDIKISATEGRQKSDNTGVIGPLGSMEGRSRQTPARDQAAQGQRDQTYAGASPGRGLSEAEQLEVLANLGWEVVDDESEFRKERSFADPYDLRTIPIHSLPFSSRPTATSGLCFLGQSYLPTQANHATRYIQPVYSHCSESAGLDHGIGGALDSLQGKVRYVVDGSSGISAGPNVDYIEHAEGGSRTEMPPVFASLDQAMEMPARNQIRALAQPGEPLGNPNLPGVVDYEDTIASLDRAVAEEALETRLQESWAADQTDQAHSHGPSYRDDDFEGFAAGVQYMSRDKTDETFVSSADGEGSAWSRQQSALGNEHQSDDSKFWRPRRYL